MSSIYQHSTQSLYTFHKSFIIQKSPTNSNISTIGTNHSLVSYSSFTDNSGIPQTNYGAHDITQ